MQPRSRTSNNVACLAPRQAISGRLSDTHAASKINWNALRDWVESRAPNARFSYRHFVRQENAASADFITGARPTRKILGLEWPREMTFAERNALAAGGFGWMLDSFDVMLYSMVLAYLMKDLGIS